MQIEVKKTLLDELAMVSPKRIFDDSVGDRVLQVNHGTNWSEVTEDVFRSWTGFRRINGEDYHGPIYGYGSLDDSVPYTGYRSCGCNTCQEHVEPKFKVS